MVKYFSSSGHQVPLEFKDLILSGLAPDNGLYMTDSTTVNNFSTLNIQESSYEDFVKKVFVSLDIASESFLDGLSIYPGFENSATPNLIQFEHSKFVMELFHGPTLAFKDFALQFLGRMFEHILTKRDKRLTIIGATSGDTGSAAIAALRDHNSINVFILYPHGRISPVQRRQMTTVVADNIHTIALEGTFDDCQDAVKTLFNDIDFRDKHHLSAVNSINWARIMAQAVYYFWAALKVGGPKRSVNFSVPTGNFGNVFAGYVAKRMGLPIAQFVVGSNSNDILARFFETGAMETTDVLPTISPSMDIQISSNFERLFVCPVADLSLIHI